MLEALVMIALAILTLGLFLYVNRSSTKRYPAGPMSFPIIGNLPQIIAAGNIINFLRKYREIYGNVFTFEIGGSKKVIIAGLDTIHHVLVENADYISNRERIYTTPDVRGTVFARGLIWAPYPDWKTVRKLVIDVLREEGMGKSVLEPKIHSEIDIYMQHFIEPNRGVPINMTQSITYATSNIVSQMVFGQRYDYEDPDLQSMNAAFSQYIKARAKDALTRNIPFASYLPESITGKGFEVKAYSVIGPKLQKIVKRTRENLDTIGTNLVVQALIKAERREVETDSVFSDDNIGAIVSHLYGAGTETTATAIRWAFLYMILYPDVQEAVRKEICEALGERKVSMKDRPSLLYTDAVISETLRLGNVSAISLPHTMENDMVIEGKRVPAGAELLINIDSTVSDPAVFPEPSQFKPERFLGDDQKLKAKMLTFSLGPRSCLGEPLARMELFLFFVSFLQKYKLSYPADQKPTLVPVVATTRLPKEYDIIFHPVS